MTQVINYLQQYKSKYLLKFLSFLLLLFFGIFFIPILANAASSTLSISPSSGKVVQNCNFNASIILDTQGNTADGLQLYIDHNLTGSGESFSLSGANLFNTYSSVQNLPKGAEEGLLGYGNDVKGSNLKVANIRFSSPNVKTADIKIHFDQKQSKTSKVAVDGSNILTGVNNGSFSVESGFCETVSPRITNLDPKNREPNHPVYENVKFDVTDNSSGVDISTLSVQVTHDNSTKTYTATDPELIYNKINSTDYSIEIDPASDFIPQEVVNVLVQLSDNAGNSKKRKYSFNDLTCKELGCAGGQVNSQCNDGKDNDQDGKIDMNDPGCSSKTDNNEYVHNSNQCNDGKDNDGDGRVDLNDPSCTSESSNTKTVTKSVTNTIYKTVTSTVTTTGNQTKIVTRTIKQVVTSTVEGGSTTTIDKPDCNDGRDNDGDRLIDTNDPGCSSKNDESEFDNASQGTLSIENLDFFIGDGTIKTEVGENRTVRSLGGSKLRTLFSLDGIDKNIREVGLEFEGQRYNMNYNNELQEYELSFPINKSTGAYNAFVQVVYNDGQFESIPFSVSVQPSGMVLGRQGGEDSFVELENAQLSIEKLNNNDEYEQFREITTNKNGTYNLFVPKGTYRIKASKQGYNDYTSAGFEVDNHILNKRIRLVRKVNLFASNVSTREKVRYVRDLATNKINKAQDLADDPQVEQDTEEKVAPLAAAVTGGVVAPALGLLNLLNYLKFLFLQPLLLFGRKKREEWGVVYDSLKRNPIDLAVVRLVDFDTDEVVRSKVTGKNGRFVFFVDPGKYRLKVEKDDYEFPSSNLEGVDEDGPYVDVYHGEIIRVEEENTGITPNIPLDPQEAEEKTPGRIKREKIIKKLQKYLAGLGLFAGVVSMIISPTWLVGVLLGLQVVFYLLFKRLGSTPEPDEWGIVREKETKDGVKNAVVRLFTKEDNKLIETELTDSKGHFAFLVGPNDYHVRFDKEGYEGYGKDITVEEEGVIEETVELNKKDDSSDDSDSEKDDLSFAE